MYYNRLMKQQNKIEQKIVENIEKDYKKYQNFNQQSRIRKGIESVLQTQIFKSLYLYLYIYET